MAIVEKSILINLSQDQVYHIAQDYYIRPQWDTFSKKIEFLNGAKQAEPGVKVSVHAHNGLKMIVEYVAVKAPERAAIKMVSGPAFFEKFAGTWIFDKHGDDSTHVTFRYGYQSKWFMIQPLFDRLIGLQFGWDTNRRLTALKEFCEAS
jgi:ribosome-associated toxin RatA of RatAB toxin-antitoxin module